MILFEISRGPERLEVRGVRELAEEERLAYLDAAAHLREHRQSRELVPILEANSDALTAHIDAVLAAPVEALRDELKRRALAVETNRLLLNYLSAGRLLLDHHQTRLSRRYGAGSNEFAAFKQVTADEYDASPAYRILYKLRNFMQHCGMPVRQVEFSSAIGANPGDPHVHEVAVVCETQYLLREYDEWGHAKADLEAAGAHIPLRSLVPAFTGALRRVEQAVYASEAESLRKSAAAIRALFEEVSKPGARAAVGEIDDHEDGSSTVRFDEVPRDVLDALAPSTG